MIGQSITDLMYGFGVALEPHNLMFCFLGVLVGNMVGVLPGMGPLATISILLPLTFGMKPVAAILMLGGVMYGAQYGGAICSILLNLPCHPPHAVTCLDGYPMTKQGRGGVALGLTVFASFVGASWGITEMIFLSPLLVTSGAAVRPGRGLLIDVTRPLGGLDIGARLADQRRVHDRLGAVPRLDRHRP